MRKKLYVIVTSFLLVVIFLFSYNREVRDFVFTRTDRIVITDRTRQQIEQLTNESVVIAYVKANGKLPDCYITKGEALKRGWRSFKKNLCEVLPGKAIGGDVFANSEHKLPLCKGRVWYTADINYSCGYRNGTRLLLSNDGLIYITYNHYKTFIQK